MTYGSEHRLAGNSGHAFEGQIHLQDQEIGATELRAMVKDAVDCYFDETMEAPKLSRLHFVRDEVLAR